MANHITINVPAGISGKALRNQINDLIHDMKQEIEEHQLIEKIMTDDETMQNFVWEHYSERAVIRAYIYGNQQDYCREFRPFFKTSCLLDNRRPVLMRGSISSMMNRYTCKGAMAEEIARRFLRRIKFTAIDFEPFDQMRNWLRSRMRENGWYVHHSFLTNWGDVPSTDHIWFQGKSRKTGDPDVRQLLEQVKSYRAKKIMDELKAEQAKREWQRQISLKRQISRDLQSKKRLKRASEIAAYELLLELTTEQQEKPNGNS